MRNAWVIPVCRPGGVAWVAVVTQLESGDRWDYISFPCRDSRPHDKRKLKAAFNWRLRLRSDLALPVLLIFTLDDLWLAGTVFTSGMSQKQFN